MYNVSIPKITDEELLKRYEKIKPIVTIGEEKYFLRDFTLKELRGRSYIGDVDNDKTVPVDMDRYVVIEDGDFECLHTYGYYGFFKPSIAEVLAQIKELDIGIVDAFEIIDSPKTASDFYKNKNAFDQGYHTSTVRLYYKTT